MIFVGAWAAVRYDIFFSELGLISHFWGGVGCFPWVGHALVLALFFVFEKERGGSQDYFNSTV